MREAESHSEKHDAAPFTTPDARADKFYVEAGQGGILYRKLTSSRLFRAEFVNFPGLQQPHDEVQASYLWAASEFGGWGLVLFSAHEFFGLGGALQIVFFVIGIPVALLLGLRRAITSPAVAEKVGLALLVAMSGAGFAAMGLLVAFKTGLITLLPNLSYAIAGLGIVGIPRLLFNRFVPSVGGYIVDQLPSLPMASTAAPGYAGAVVVKQPSARSAFISYGGNDESFARKLSEVLNQNGVPTFFFPNDAVPGEKLHRTMKKGINEHDRVILVCSRASLDRKGVLTELEETLAREHRDGSDYLIPIRLDAYVLKDWAPKNPDLAQSVRDRVVADFEGADTDDDKFQTGLRKLIAALRK